ncbi:hypothetical protein BpHYR1_030502 [Brachionus plicatilis]|uniref:Uncharacterized protein n=1 Tax=Brachionus plicatilis TaxID=10195 RepID=A0A3M7R7U7_BRAPC|nr:hypothetical protein BpHYR1_030502 [Brachionus plicatilis]
MLRPIATPVSSTLESFQTLRDLASVLRTGESGLGAMGFRTGFGTSLALGECFLSFGMTGGGLVNAVLWLLMGSSLGIMGLKLGKLMPEAEASRELFALEHWVGI